MRGEWLIIMQLVKKTPISSGQPVDLVCNYFPVAIAPGKQIYIYHLQYTPDIPPQSQVLRKQVFTKAKSQIEPVLGRCSFANTTVFAAGAG